jgi:hypothetical protein
LLRKTDYLTENQYNSLFRDAEELRKMLSSATKTIKDKEN